MAEIVTDESFQENRGASLKYPWAEWSDGQVRKLTKGIDFTCEVENLQNAVYSWARRHDLKGRTSLASHDQVIVQMLPRDTSL